MRTGRAITVVLLSVVFILVATSYAVMEMKPFQYGYNIGAYAKIEFKVVDDESKPVSNATVNVLFDMANMALAKEVIVHTDTNGTCIAKERTKGVMKVHVSKDGYYSTNDEISFIDMGHEHDVKHGKWQPWGMEKQIILLPIKNPIAKVAAIAEWKNTRQLKKWIGFDLMKYDFVKPHGTGEYSDMEVFFDWDGKRSMKEYNGIDLNIRFQDKFSGGYVANRVVGSKLEGVYKANPNANYKTNFAFFEHVVSRNPWEGYPTKMDRQFFDNKTVLVVRSRCKLNDYGTLKSAHYFQLSYIDFACANENEAAIRFLSIYNPTPNDTTLEPQ